MSWVAVGVAAVSLVGGMMGSASSKKAAQKQQDAANAAIARQDGLVDDARRDYDVYMQGGQEGTSRLRDMLKPGGELNREFEFSKDPSYDFGQRQGQQALERMQSAQGRRTSPASLAALLRYNQDYAGTKYGEAFARDQATKAQTFQLQSFLPQLGYNATNSVTNAGQQAGTNAMNLMTGAGNAQAAGIMGSNAAMTSGMNNAAGSIGQQMMLNQYLGNAGKSSSGGMTGAQANPDAYSNMAALGQR